MEYGILTRVINEDNVDELAKILNSNRNQNFNLIHSRKQTPLLHFTVQDQSQKVLEYLLSLDFVDKSICNFKGENIYFVVCRIRGAEQLFSIIEKNVPHHLLQKYSFTGKSAFQIA